MKMMLSLLMIFCVVFFRLCNCRCPLSTLVAVVVAFVDGIIDRLVVLLLLLLPNKDADVGSGT
ncbi:hypothetical protein BDB00DRAFT_837026 [Zychaea mexicana]|uniref:uncharacterized protein n=1 Tax=Zychaea mexicana TaxID=64656 RepID=UPI0022FDB9AC|nr:uncharacterized protein BDB00DRAFT_837026 [Zychaea mexicana]KAI9490559.1 hypothetical protein BDB00DRAFT_837026 [Zychaea mexicana]